MLSNLYLRQIFIRLGLKSYYECDANQMSGFVKQIVSAFLTPQKQILTMNEKTKIRVTLLSAAGLLTLIPFESQEINYFGYHSLCSFATLSTFLILGAAAIFYYIGKKTNN